jgi:hypothetical protein
MHFSFLPCVLHALPTSSSIRLDPQSIKRVMDVGGPSALNTTLKKPKKVRKNKSDKTKLRGKSTTLTKEPNTRCSPQWAWRLTLLQLIIQIQKWPLYGQIKKPLQLTKPQKKSEPVRAKSASPVMCPSGNHSVTVAADVHCSPGGTKAARQGMQKPTLSARASSEPGGRNCHWRNGNIDILIDLRMHLQPSMFSQGNYSTIDHNLSNYIVSLVAEPITEPLDVMSSVLVMFVGGSWWRGALAILLISSIWCSCGRCGSDYWLVRSLVFLH